MKTLTQRLLEITAANTVKKATKESINDLIVKVLADGKKLDRTELVAAISQLRLESELKMPLTDKMMDDPAIVDQFVKTLKTVKNGVDTSISRSNNNSSFHFNPDFKMYNLDVVAGKYFIEKIK